MQVRARLLLVALNQRLMFIPVASLRLQLLSKQFRSEDRR
jgi:hypothetical protein